MSECQQKKSNKICYIVTIPLTIRAFFVPQLKFLAENGFNVTVVCSHDAELQAELGEKVLFNPIEIPRGISILGMLKATYSLMRFFKSEKFDLVQYSTPNAALCASIAAKLAGCKKRNYHLMGLRYLGAGRLGKLVLKTLEKITCRLSTSIECVSRSNMEMGISEGLFPKEKVTVVWNGSTGGVNLKRFDYKQRSVWREQVRQEMGYSADDFVYGFAGRITKDKGINEILSAFFNLQDESKLLFVGSIEGEQTLDSQLLEKARNHPQIQFHDVVTDIERYYAAMDVLLLPSYREGFGNVIIEAGAVGTPAIVSNIPGPIDAIEENVTALVVPVNDVGALQQNMKAIQHKDYIEMGKKAAGFVKDHFDTQHLNECIVNRKKKLLLEER